MSNRDPQKRKAYMEQYNPIYYKSHKQKILEDVKAYTQAHKAQKNEYLKHWHNANKNYISNCGKIYYQEHKEQKLAYQKHYRQLHKRERRIYLYNCRHIPQYSVNHQISTAIWAALKGNKAGRRWETLVGYTLIELMNHLEKLFNNKMSWDNYGRYEEGKFKWHIDHIKPKSLFHYENPEDIEFKRCWSLENLQPLEAIKNLRKNNKYYISRSVSVLN